MVDFSKTEKHTADFNNFVSGLRGEGYEDKLVRRYPNAEFTFEGNAELPAKKDHQVWCCDSGRGEVDPILVPYCTSSRIGPAGVIAATFEGIWVSPRQLPGCDEGEMVRYYGMDLWDDFKDDLVDPPVRLEGN